MATDLEKLREKFPFIEGFDQNLANVSAAAFGGNAPTQVETPEQSNPTQTETPRQMSGIERRSGGASDPFAFLTSGPGGGRGSSGSTARPTTLPTSSPTLPPTPAPQVPVGQGTVLQTPQVPSMESVGLNPLTTEPQFGGVAQTPSLQPQFDAGVAETQARLGAMFGEAPQTLTQLTTGIEGAVMAQDAQGRMRTYESQEAADQALEAGMSVYDQESAAREARMGDGFSVRPGIDVPSLDMQRKRMEAGLSPTEGAPMGTDMSQQQQADMLERGFDPATGQRIGGDMSEQERANLAKTKAQIETEQIRQAGMIQEIQQRGIKAKEVKSEAEAQSIGELTSYGEQINKLTGVRDEIAKLTGNRKTTEGGLGWLNAKLPLGSNARSVARLVKEIEGSTFIRGIIDAKNRGATFGPLSDQEGANIVAAYGKILEPDMRNEDRIRAINELLGAMNSGFIGATDRHKAKYGGAIQQDAPSSATGGTIPSVEGVTIRIK